MNNVEQFNKNLFLENDSKIDKMEYQKCFIELLDKKFKLDDIVQYRNEYYDMYKKSENISDVNNDKNGYINRDKMFYIKVKGLNIETIKKCLGKSLIEIKEVLKPEPESESEYEAESEYETEPDSDSEYEPKHKPKHKVKFNLEPEFESEPESEPGSELEPVSKAELEPESEPESKAEPESEAVAETESLLKSEPEPKKNKTTKKNDVKKFLFRKR